MAVKDTKAGTKAPVAKAKKTAKAVEVKTLEQLHEDLAKIRNDYQESRRSHRMGELVNPRVLTVQRKDVARALTAIKQAELAAAKSAKPEKSATKEEN